MPPRKRLKRWLVYILARALISLWNVLPFNLALFIGRHIGRFAGRLAGSPRRRAEAQMMEALSIEAPEAKRKVNSLFEHCGMLAVELAMLPRLQGRLADYVQLKEEDRKTLSQALEAEKGAIIVSAHLGNWELLAQRMVIAGFGSSTLARLNPNPYLGRWIVQQRSRFGLTVIDRSESGAARKVLGALKKNHLVGFLIDQDTRVESVHVPFFGRLASTPSGAAQFALRKNIPVFAVFCHRVGSGHEISLSRISTEDLPGETDNARIKALTAEMTKHIENAIRAHPSQWMWFHERWKTKDVAVSGPKG